MGDITKSMRKRPLESFKIFPKAIMAGRRERRDAKHTKEGLYKNKGFLLIHVVKETGDSGENVTLRVMSPAADPSMVDDIEKQGGYYCISHVWGSPDQWEEWNDSGVTDAQGNPLPIKIRPEKRAKLLRLFNTYGGYWWVDVFCAQHDTPLDIMGDIYRHSKVTYALIDCPADSFTRIREANVDELDDFRMYAHRDELVDNYLDQLKNTGQIMSPDDLTWHQVLDSILRWWYTRGEDKRYFLDAIADIISCNWFTRVWTLQEATLPKTLHFMLESDDPGCVSLDAGVMFSLLEFTCRFIRLAQERFDDQAKGNPDRGIQEQLAKHSRKVMGKTLVLANNHQGFADTLDRFFLKDAHLSLSILHLSLDKRTCLKPCDYVYGVIGYLQINLQRMSDPNKVWQAFLDEVEPRLPKHAPLPRSFDLANAKDMASVYSSFLPKRLLEMTDTWKYVSNICDTPY